MGIYPQGDEREVIIEVDAQAAPYLLERCIHRSQKVRPREDDGTVQISLQVAGRTELLDWVLTLGEHAQIVSPPDLRAEMAARVAALARHYGVGGEILFRDDG